MIPESSKGTLPITPRRSSRIQDNLVNSKRKIEVESIEEVEETKRPKKAKTNKNKKKDGTSFNIFKTKQEKASKIESTSVEKREVSVSSKAKALPSKPKNILDVKKSTTIYLDDSSSNSDDPEVIIPEATIVQREYNFVSSFVEYDFPAVTQNNHIQQASNSIAVETNSLKFKSGNLQPPLTVFSADELESVNCYFSPSSDLVLQIKSRDARVDNNAETDLSSAVLHEVWVEKYKPKKVADILGHSASVEQLVNWLTEWKQKLKRSKRKNEDSNSSCSFDYSDDEEDDILKCVMITGSSGRGKTSVVYAVAQELGFKVFEVNPSASRIGRHVLSQLQEATLSHHVEGTKINPFFQQFKKQASLVTDGKPAVDSKKIKFTDVKPKPGAITNFFKKASPEEIASKSKAKEKILKEKSKQNLLNFFKPKNAPASKKDCQSEAIVKGNEKETSSETAIKVISVNSQVTNSLTTNEDGTNIENTETVSAGSDNSSNSNSTIDSASKQEIEVIADITSTSETNTSPSDVNKPNASSVCDTNVTVNHEPDEHVESSHLKFSSLSVILFDDADVNLTEDDGFWQSINSFLKVTRKPVILTASQNIEELSDSLSSNFTEIDFGSAQHLNMLEHMKNVSKLENLTFEDCELQLLLQHCNFDLRQCITQLQFWAARTNTMLDTSQIFGIPVSLFCLNKYISGQVLNWTFEWDLTQAVELHFNFVLNSYDLLQNNLHHWLPFPIRPKELEKLAPKPKKKYKRLDISWLSDEGSDNEETSINNNKTSKNEKKEKSIESPSIITSLIHLSNLYDSFSQSDVLGNYDYNATSYSFPSGPYRQLKNTHCSPKCIEVATWVSLVSARHCKNVLQEIDLDSVHIYEGEFKSVQFHSLPVIENKLVQSRENITTSVLGAQRLNHRARCLDYFSMLRTVAKCELQRKEDNPKRSRRFLHYFGASGFGIGMDDLNYLSNAF